jgi:hypothetical protein
VLGVRRRREKPTDLFGAENNGQAARLAADTTSSARSLRFSVTLKKNCRELALALTVGTVVPIDASRS